MLACTGAHNNVHNTTDCAVSVATGILVAKLITKRKLNCNIFGIVDHQTVYDQTDHYDFNVVYVMECAAAAGLKLAETTISFLCASCPCRLWG